MKVIKQPYEKVIAIIKTNRLESENGWRMSLWSVPYDNNGIHLIKNTFSGEIVRLTDEEYAAPENVEELKKHRFIVPVDFDETEKYAETVKLIKLMQPNKKTGLRSYTILPTTACNARCTYCYEEGYATSTMTRETAARLVDYICETRYDDKITLSWFGGEPLVGAQTISFVCRELEKKGVPFKSRMVTNASLFTPEMIKEAKEVWKTEQMQISLDGDRRSYNERKRYVDQVKYNYDSVLEKVKLIADQGIKIRMRVNFDKDNLLCMQGFIDDIESRFGGYENVSMYLSMLFQQQRKENCTDVYRDMFELYKKNRHSKILHNAGNKDHFRLNCCMADNLEKSIIIDPKGELYNCETLYGNDYTWGNIFDGVTDERKLESLKEPTKIAERCEKCPYLPECTAFYCEHCPDWFEKCREYNDLRTEYELSCIAEKEIENE